MSSSQVASLLPCWAPAKDPPSASWKYEVWKVVAVHRSASFRKYESFTLLQEKPDSLFVYAVDEMPEMSEVFLRYRELKKQLKRMPHTDSSSNLQEGQIILREDHFQTAS